MIRIFEALPSVYKPKEIEKVNGVIIDNVNGKGSTPLNQEINYLGFVVYMKPSTFLELALRGLRDPELASSYSGEPIGAPFLQVYYTEENNTIEVSDHEGRHRVSGIINSLGDDFQIPVHIKAFGKKARYFTPEGILKARWISQNGREVDMSDATFYLRGERIN